MPDFRQALERTLAWEGGYKLHEVAGDPGGMTFAGIARRRHKDWEGWWRILAGDTGSDSLKERVAEFYRQTFWAPLWAEVISFQSVAEAIFDFAVNAGSKAAVETLQETLGARIVARSMSPVSSSVIPRVDGIMGPITLGYLNAVSPPSMLSDYTLARIRFYAELAEWQPHLRKFFRGWVNRALAFSKKKES